MGSCILCGSSDLRKLIEIYRIPIYCNRLFETAGESRKVPRGDLILKYCNSCDHIFNDAFCADLIDYYEMYDASLDFSPRFQAYAQALAEKLITLHKLQNKTVVEIACGRGGFLNQLAELAHNQYIGFDPSNLDKIDSKRDVKIVSEYFSPTQDTLNDNVMSHFPADFVICRHALEHIDNPTEMITGLYDIVEKNKSTEVYFEVPNALFLVRDLSIWDFIYEHVSYFSPVSLYNLFENAGFIVNDCYETYEGQFIALHGSNSVQNKLAVEGAALTGSERYIGGLRTRFKNLLDVWNKFLIGPNKKTVLWGAGSKGVTFLNIVKNSQSVAAIVDLNPNKIGKFTAGTGHKIISSEQLKELKPDNVVVMNPIYRDEITIQLREMGLDPAIHVVGE